MAAPIEQSIADIFKSGEAIQSFVIDEIALAELLRKAWRPIGRKILRQASAVIDFKKKKYKKAGVAAIAVWMTDDMYDDTLRNVWKKIAPTVQKFIGKSYQRGIDEEGENPFVLAPAVKSVQKSVSSVYAERKAQAVDILTKMAEGSFTGYAHDVAIPDFYSTVKKLGKIDALINEYEKQNGLPLDADAKEILRYEQARRLRLAAMDKTQKELIDKFYAKITNQQHAQAIANMVTAKAHHFGFLDWCKENGILYYKVVAVLDARTCKACAAMDGKIFSVKDALAYKDKFLKIQGDKDKLKQEMPFLTAAEAKNIFGIDLDEPWTFAGGMTDFALDGEWETLKFKSSNERYDKAFGWATDFSKHFVAGLSKEEEAAIKFYKDTDYESINNYLRGNITRDEMPDAARAALETLKQIYDKAPPVPENITLYRGIPHKDRFSKIIGSEKWEDAVGKDYVIDKSFMSTSLSPKCTEHFAYERKNPDPLFFKIYLKRGSKSAIFLDNIRSGFDEELEMLFRPETKFTVLSVEKKKQGMPGGRITLLCLD